MKALKKRPWWQVLLLLIGGFAVFTAFYALCQCLQPELHWLNLFCNILYCVSMIGIYALAVWTFERKLSSDLPAGKILPHVGAGLVIGTLFFCIVIGVLALSGNCIVSYSGLKKWAFFLPLVQYFFVACSEEVIFRGIMFRIIDEKWGFVWAIVINSLFFGTAHMANPHCTIWTALAIAIEAGLLLSAAYKWSGTLWLPIGIHWAWNFVEGPVLGAPVSGGNSYDSVLKTSVSGSDIMTGGAFGLEGSIVTVIVGTAISAFFIWRICRKEKASE